MAALASPSKGQSRYGKAPSIKSKPAMKEEDAGEGVTPREEGTPNAPRPASGTGGAKPKPDVMDGTDGIKVEDQATSIGMRHEREHKEMNDRHLREHEETHSRHHDERKKMHKRHADERKAGMTEGYAEQAEDAGSMGVTAGQ